MYEWSIIEVEITSASIHRLLTLINADGIPLINIQYLDDLHIRTYISDTNLSKLRDIAKKHGDTVNIISERGFRGICRRWLHRPILLIGMICWIFLVLFLPTRVLFVRVNGNLSTDTERILESAERFGISFGASRRYVRSERVKNALLADIESLQWVGVNTYGCVAVISVKERAVHDDAENTPGVRSIFANRDGIITEICVTKGKQICQVGQAVRSGQILVSGYTDCGFSVKAENAEAEIKAITNRQLSAVSLTTGQLRRTNLKNITRYSIQIGKNIVKLQDNSGIYDAGCVKIYNKKNLTLPGGFVLPISLIQEKFFYYDNEESDDLNENNIRWVGIAADRYLQSDMLAGRILDKTTEGDFSNGCYNYYGVYICEEMIGQLQLENRGEHNGERCN